MSSNTAHTFKTQTTAEDAGLVTTYTGTGISDPQGITAGPDGALWFTNEGGYSIGRITTTGVITNYTGTGIASPGGITAGPDGALWFTNEGNNSIGRITTAGVITNYTGTGIASPGGITAGPDGALWFTNFGNNSIGRITTAGVVTNYTGTDISDPFGIGAGPDGALWFTNESNDSIGRITTAGVVTNYTGTGMSDPLGITAGSDGALWFTNFGNDSIGRITTTGLITNYSGVDASEPAGIAAGPDGALWFTNEGNNSIGRITTAGAFTNYTGTGISEPDGIAAGPDGALWFTNYPTVDAGNSIGRITVSLGNTPTFVADSPPLTAEVGSTYSYTFAAAGSPAPTYALTGSPSWLSINSSSGLVSGTPPSGATTFSYSVVASNSSSSNATAGPFTVAVNSGSLACNDNDHVIRSPHLRHTVPTTNLGFTPLLTPVRIADTRTGATDPSTFAGDTLCPGGSLTVDMPSSIPADAGAIVAQLTAINPTMGGYLAAYPAGGTIPSTANVSFVAGQIVGNMVTIGIGTDSSTGAPAVSIFNGPSGDTDFTLDLYGYYAPQTPSSGAAYVPLTSPTRIVDTRAGSGYNGAGETLTPQANSIHIPVAGSNGVPLNASAVVVNIAVVNTTASSYIQGYPGGSPPSSSAPTVNENWLAGEVLSTKAIIAVGLGGNIDLFNDQGSTDVVVDLEGYFTAPGAAGALFNTLGSPVRLADTRPNAVTVGESLSVPVAGSNGIPSNATAAVLNVTDLAGGPNYLSVYPAGQSEPVATDVDYVSGDTSSTVANASYAILGSSGAVNIFDSTSPANIVIDAFGYFSS
jgi:virginiamycin B lyase